MKKHKTSALLCLLLAAVCLTACGENDPGETGAPLSEEETTAEETLSNAPVVLTAGGKPLYKIIRAEKASEDTIDAAIRLRRGLEELMGVNLAFGTDWSADNSLGEGELEILVGATNRPESAEVGADLRPMEYVVKIVGEKVVINAGSAHALGEGIEAFLHSDLLNLTDAGEYELLNQPFTGTVMLADGKLPYYPEGEVELYRSSGETVVLKAEDVSVESYDAYLVSMKEAGYELYAESTMGDNRFATFTGEDLAVRVGYMTPTKTARVIWEPLTNLPPRAEDNVYDKTNPMDTMLTSLELAEGMSYVYRLEDGSFIIFDGGRIDPDEKAADDLMKVLNDQCPEGEKPVIAAWMFSHPHGDHLGTFNYFILKYHDEVTVESIYYNFANEEDIWTVDPQVLDPSYYKKLNLHYWEYCSGYYFFKHIEEYLPDTTIIKPHTGDRFYIRNAEIEILHTIEELFPETLVTMGQGGNAQNVTYRVFLEGQSFLMLGDSSESCSAATYQHWGNYLKSDAMQMAHHGYNGGDLNLYKAANPEYALLPTTREAFFGVMNYDFNQWLRDSKSMKMMFVSGFGTYSVKLPIALTREYDRLPRRGNNPVLYE